MREGVGRSKPIPAWLIGVLVVALAGGVVLRLSNLAGKVFWQDEAVTAMRVSGYQEHSDLRPLFDGRIRSAGELRRLERPSASRGIFATVGSLAAEDSHHGVLFYLLEGLAVRVSGTVIWGYRILPALLGVIGLWVAWLLARTLFGTATGAALFVAILALSPFEVLYAHQAREYTFTALMTLLCSYLLLSALRRQRFVDWPAYSLAVAAGLYGSLFIALVVLGHMVYVALCVRSNRKAVFAFALACCGAALLYAPWIAVMLERRHVVTTYLDWGDTSYPIRLFAEKWLFNTGAQFFDLEWLNLKLAVVGAGILLLIAASLAVLVRRASTDTRTFVLSLGGTTALFFLAHDALAHSHWSTTARYLIPTWLAIQLAVAYAFDTWIFRKGEAPRHARAAAAVFVVLLVLQGICATAGTRANAWYDDELSAPVPYIARAIDERGKPLIIGEKSWMFYLELSNYLRPNVQVQLFSGTPSCNIDIARYDAVFTSTPDSQFARALARRGFELRQVYRFANKNLPYTEFHASLKGASSALAYQRIATEFSYPSRLYQIVPDTVGRYRPPLAGQSNQ